MDLIGQAPISSSMIETFTPFGVWQRVVELQALECCAGQRLVMGNWERSGIAVRFLLVWHLSIAQSMALAGCDKGRPLSSKRHAAPASPFS